MNELCKQIRTRRSIRKYKSEAVPRELLDSIVEAGLYAASGRGTQNTIILQITDKALRDKLMKMNAAVMGRTDIDPFYGAPAVLVVLGKKDCPTFLYDGSLAMGNMMLAAHSLGLGSCWIHRAKEVFNTDEGKMLLSKLGLEGDYEGIGNCIVGYPDGEYPKEPPRKSGRVFVVE